MVDRSSVVQKIALTALVYIACLAVRLHARGHTASAETGHASFDPQVGEILNGMSLEEKVGQMFQIRVYGDYTSFTSPEFRAVCLQIARFHIGSVVLGARLNGPNLQKGKPEQVAAIMNALQRTSKLPLLVGADLERGLASRLSDVPDFPFPMSFGATSVPATAEKFGFITAEEARAVGIHWAFAPVADVNSNPENPIITNRSFGDDPARVGKLVAAFIRGAHQGGMMVTVKHFPGEGDTATDPHSKATRIQADRAHLESNELVPFRFAINANADAVMLAQASVPAIEPDETKIATTSGKVVGGLLRKELGFTGIVITDALEMKGIAALYSGDPNPSGHLAVDAVEAGNDVLMFPLDLNAAFTAVVAAVRNGEIPESRIDKSVRRILESKASLGLTRSRIVDLEHVRAVFSEPEPYQFAQEVSDAAVTLVRNNTQVLPISSFRKWKVDERSPTNKVVMITFTDSRRSPLGKKLEEELSVRNPNARVFHYYYDQIGSDAISATALSLGNADAVVLAPFVVHVTPRLVSYGTRMTQEVGFAGAGAQLFGELLAVAPEKTVVVALGSPYLIESFPQIKNYVCTYSLASTAEVSAIKALFGEIHNNATLPVSLHGIAGHGTSVPWPGSSPVTSLNERSVRGTRR